MATYEFQLASQLFLSGTGGVHRVLVPVTPFLLLAGNIAHPRSPVFVRFLAWASQRWERVWFVAGALESGHEADCAAAAQRFHNVRFLDRTVDPAVPGLTVVGAGPADDEWLLQHATPDAIVVSPHAPRQAHGALKWAHGVASAHAPQRCVCNDYRAVRAMLDTSYYFVVDVPPATYTFTTGRDPFPVVRHTKVRAVGGGPPVELPHLVCFFCGHRGHSKHACPVIQCKRCHRFGHGERACPDAQGRPWRVRFGHAQHVADS